MATPKVKLENEDGDISLRSILMLAIPLLALLAGGLWYALRLVEPPPQKTVVIATGGEGGAYQAFGKLYAAELKKQGIAVKLTTTAGAIANMALLHDQASDVNVALMQGGIATPETAQGLVSIGRMFYEPLWVFYKSTETWDQLGQLKGRRIAVGAEGSGTRALNMTLMGAAHVGADNATLLPISGQAAVDGLAAGTLDAAMLIFAPEAPLLQKLLHDPSVKLMSLSQAEALTSLYPYLSHLVLPEGVIDLEKNIPAHGVDLVAPAAALVARDDLHPALISQLAEAASKIHARPNLLTKAGEFPKSADPEFVMSPDAQRLYKSGPPILQRYMPFWVANFLQRLLVLLVPLATVALPLFRGIPAFIRWQVQRKMTYWYRRLNRLENGITEGTTGHADQTDEIDTIAKAVATIRVPRAYSEQLFNLKGHIDMVRARLGAKSAGASVAAS